MTEDRLPAAAEAVRLGAIAGSVWCGLGGDRQAQGGNREEPEEDDVTIICPIPGNAAFNHISIQLTGEHTFATPKEHPRAVVDAHSGLRVRSCFGWKTPLLPELAELQAGLTLDGELVAFQNGARSAMNRPA